MMALLKLDRAQMVMRRDICKASVMVSIPVRGMATYAGWSSTESDTGMLDLLIPERSISTSRESQMVD